MNAHIITIFPEVFEAFKDFGIFRIASEKSLFSLYIHNLRDFTKDRHKTTDDRPYGGGAGMVMLAEPISKAFSYIDKNFVKTFKVLITPQGETFNQKLAQFLSLKDSIAFLPAHYEGVDERISGLVDMELSVGDYVLSGGELPCLIVLDALLRLVPGVLGNITSASEESFSKNLLEYPHYTRPREFVNESIADVLISGNHEDVRKWRLKESLKRTLIKRPDLIKSRSFTEEEKKLLKEIFDEIEETAKEILK